MQYPWQQTKRYNDYSTYIKDTFGERVQKLSVNAGFTCPNRDGSKGTGGCHFCNNSTFNPGYCKPSVSITEQLNQGIAFFRDKYKTQQYLAYFQAYSNTYGETEFLLKQYREALDHPKVIGLVLGTRPDCISEDLLQELAKWKEKYYLAIELGVESTNDDTLNRINRGHGYAETVEATNLIAKYDIPVGAHLILGLPGESVEIIIQHATTISELPVTFIKLHQLQIVKGSQFEKDFKTNPDGFSLYTADKYVDLVVDFLEMLSPKIIVERFMIQ